jgi:ketosteroid isomerase-like protein
MASYSRGMQDAHDPIAVDRQFFAALIAADTAALERLLADDFLLIDVMTGSEVPRAALLEVVGSGQLAFEAIDPAEVRCRRYGATAVVTGRTRMAGRYAGAAFGAASRYTHVYVEERNGDWRMVAAQGTPIASPT